jgi:transketolase
MRQTFVDTATRLLADDPRTAVVLADISADAFRPAAARHPDRVVNLGIREQLMIGVAGGLALTGMRPIVHSYATFVVDRAYEQIKLDLDHQGAGAILVSVGGSYDGAPMGRTHMSPGDVSLLDTMAGWTVHVPGHPAEIPPLLRAAAGHDGNVYMRLSTLVNDRPRFDGPWFDGALHAVRTGQDALVVAVGPLLDPVLRATEGLDVTVAYTNTPRPLDTAALRALLPASSPVSSIVLVEPYLAGTSSRLVADALLDVPHRLLALGVGREDLHRFGSPKDHARWHGLDAAGLHRSIAAFVTR